MSEGIDPWIPALARLIDRWLPLRWSVPLLVGGGLLLALLVPPLVRWWSGG